MSSDEKDKYESGFQHERELMVTHQLLPRGIKDPLVIEAMRKVPRHLFVDDSLAEQAYYDGPLPIGFDQTISQPYIVASMTQELAIDETSKVLEIGTGCGYQAAVLAEIANKVFSVEIIPYLFKETKSRLSSFSYKNLHLKQGDGSLGWEEFSPFDAIMITATAPRIPEQLLPQLKLNGIMLLPLGKSYHNLQQLVKIKKTRDGFKQESLYAVRFVPMTGMVRD